MSGTKNLKIEKLDFNITTLRNLWEQDYNEQNFKKMRQDDILEIIDDKPLKSKEYLERRLLKFSSDEFGYFENASFKIQTSVNILQNMIPKPLLAWFKLKCEPYKKISDPMLDEIDYAKKTINMFPTIPHQKIDVYDYNDERIKLLMKFITKVICNGKKDKLVWIINFIKRLINGQRTFAIPFLYGNQGLGKSLFISILKCILGENRCLHVEMVNWADKFSSFVENKQLLYTEETVDKTNANVLAEYDKAINRMKGVCTDSNISIRAMRKDIAPIQNFSNIIFGSNNLLPVDELKGRRFRLFNILVRMEASEYEMLGKSLEDEKFTNKMYNYFCEYHIEKNEIVKDLQTFDLEDDAEFKDVMKVETVCNVYKYLYSIIGNLKDDDKIQRSTFNKNLDQYCKSNGLATPQNIKAYTDLQKIGVKLMNPKNVYTYKFENIEEIKKQLEKEGAQYVEGKQEEEELKAEDVFSTNDYEENISKKDQAVNIKHEYEKIINEKENIIKEQGNKIRDLERIVAEFQKQLNMKNEEPKKTVEEKKIDEKRIKKCKLASEELKGLEFEC